MYKLQLESLRTYSACSSLVLKSMRSIQYATSEGALHWHLLHQHICQTVQGIMDKPSVSPNNHPNDWGTYLSNTQYVWFLQRNFRVHCFPPQVLLLWMSSVLQLFTAQSVGILSLLDYTTTAWNVAHRKYNHSP